MKISSEGFLVIVIVGAIAGARWTLVKGGGFRTLGDLVIGIVGAFIGSLILLRLGIHSAPV